MIYVSLTTIPSRVQDLNKSVESLLQQSQKPDKIFINIPYKYRRFKEVIADHQIPKLDDKIAASSDKISPNKFAVTITSYF